MFLEVTRAFKLFPSLTLLSRKELVGWGGEGAGGGTQRDAHGLEGEDARGTRSRTRCPRA